MGGGFLIPEESLNVADVFRNAGLQHAAETDYLLAGNFNFEGFAFVFHLIYITTLGENCKRFF